VFLLSEHFSASFAFVQKIESDHCHSRSLKNSSALWEEDRNSSALWEEDRNSSALWEEDRNSSALWEEDRNSYR
jgi:hypothetical protein